MLAHGPKTPFQQYNASPHTFKAPTEFIKGEQLNVMAWPLNNPDLSPIETVWAVLAERVYTKIKHVSKMSRP